VSDGDSPAKALETGLEEDLIPAVEDASEAVEGAVKSVGTGVGGAAGRYDDVEVGNTDRFTKGIEGSSQTERSAATSETRQATQAAAPTSRISEILGGGETPGVTDPAMQQGALGNEFNPGVHDPNSEFQPHEKATADRLAEEGWQVDQRPADHTQQGLRNPDTMVRKSPDDPGTITELKSLDSPSNNALKRNINDAGGQNEGGDAVIDGRGVGTTLEDATRAYKRALGQPGGKVPSRVHIILGDGSIATFEKE
jgi:hypothetical protein